MNPEVIGEGCYTELISIEYLPEVLEKDKQYPLSWYGPTKYDLGIKENYKYTYMLSDQNFVFEFYRVGQPTNKIKNVKSFPILIREKVIYENNIL